MIAHGVNPHHPAMNTSELQRRIDEISWYHEFSFPNGLRAIPTPPDITGHRRLWAFIEGELDQLDFQDKTVLDIGCWDGYWSFYAERRGARRVLATDDKSQNWAGSAGLMLALELLGSKIEPRLDVSIYDLSRLEHFDIILCLGVWYHLVDPFYAFAQVRHRCHRDSIVIFEGDILLNHPPGTIHFDLSGAATATFLPTAESLKQMWKATYFEIVSEASLIQTFPEITGGARKKFGRIRQFRRRVRRALLNKPTPADTDRSLVVCRPVEVADNRLHLYRPPFGLHAYDHRFRNESPA